MKQTSSSQRNVAALPDRVTDSTSCLVAKRRARGLDDSSLSLEAIVVFIDAHLGDPLPLARLAALGGLSVWRFATVFRMRTGEPPLRYVLRRRIERAQALLRQGVPPSRVALETGFYDQSHLHRHFKRLCGMTPCQYSGQAGARGQASERAP